MFPGKLEKRRPLQGPIIRVTTGSCEKEGTVSEKEKEEKRKTRI
jgi:hypothetical protein